MGITLTNHIDLAQVVLYLFWAFFAGLIFYLHRENKREGYPLVAETLTGRVERIEGIPNVPKPKTYLLRHGEAVSKPDFVDDTRPIAAVPAARFPGAPLTPTGNPMIDGVGPAAWAARHDEPERMWDGALQIVPLRAAPGFDVCPDDPDPRGMTVVAGDRKAAGTVVDAWVDRAEYLFRYYEVELAGSGARVLVPVPFCVVDAGRRQIRVRAIFAHQFADVPKLKGADQVTVLEEERIAAYYGGGTLYAEPRRAEPLL